MRDFFLHPSLTNQANSWCSCHSSMHRHWQNSTHCQTSVVNYELHPSPSFTKTTALRTKGSMCHLTKERDAGAGAGVLVQAGQPVAFRKGEQHQPWLVNPLLRVFLHWEPFLKAVEILYSKAILSTLFCKKQWNTAVNGLITMAALSSGVQGLFRPKQIH